MRHHKRSGRWALVIAAMLLVPCVSFSASVRAADSTAYVGTTSDSTTVVSDCGDPANTDCTLRDAIAAVAGAAGTVQFGPHFPTGAQTILLGSGSGQGTLILASDVTIIGPTGQTVAVDGGCTGCDPGGTPIGGVQVFNVNSGVTASISNLTIQHGLGTYLFSGGITNQGTLTLMSSAIIRNFGGTSYYPCGNTAGTAGIRNDGTMAVMNSVVADNNGGPVGGIWNNGMMTVTGSTIARNFGSICQASGGVYNTGTLTLTASTVTGNNTNDVGHGSGISNNGTLTVIASLITGNGNSGPAGGIWNNGTLTMANITIASNAGISAGGMVMQGGTLTLRNGTVADNNGGTVGGINVFGGTLDLANTIVSGNQGVSGTDGITDMWPNGHNLIGPNAMLGTLGNNGGPTETIPPLSGSPAIDAGDPSVCAAAPVSGRDQRGFPRRADRCTIGAYESDPDIPGIPSLRPSASPVSGASPLPPSRPSGSVSGSPNPLPPPRP